jgi:hypothetical protein
MSAMRKKRDRHDNRQQRKRERFPTVCSIANQQTSTDGENQHYAPRPNGNAVPPGSLGVSLSVQYIVHP